MVLKEKGEEKVVKILIQANQRKVNILFRWLFNLICPQTLRDSLYVVKAFSICVAVMDASQKYHDIDSLVSELISDKISNSKSYSCRIKEHLLSSNKYLDYVIMASLSGANSKK